MNITVDTVRTYVKNVLAKLGAHSRLQLAALASRDGLLIDQATAADAFLPRISRSSGPPQIAAEKGPSPEAVMEIRTTAVANDSCAHRRPASRIP